VLSFRLGLGLLALCVGCTDDSRTTPRATAPDLFDASGPSTAVVVTPERLALPAGCVEDWIEPPASLACTGLYLSPADKQVHPDIREFVPADQLWTDGAEKRRWLWLPKGSVIDTLNPNEWSFPVGTKVWKEFKRDGRRLETRLFHKVKQDAAERWIWASYQWKDDETHADFTWGGIDVPVVTGTPHYIPKSEECLTCHRGRTDRLLGVEAVLLGLPGAQGVSLASLVADRRLSSPPSRSEYVIPDDGTGLAAPVMSWLHVNCGVSCHNENPNSKAGLSGQFLRIDARQLETAAPLHEWNTIKTTLNQQVVATYFGSVRIVPGAPDSSLLLRLASTRGALDQMPPLGTRVVDAEQLARVRAWIARLDHGLVIDAGAPLHVDAGGPVVVPPDAGTTNMDDAQVPSADAATTDAEGPLVVEAGVSETDASQVGDAGLTELVEAGAPDDPITER